MFSRLSMYTFSFFFFIPIYKIFNYFFYASLRLNEINDFRFNNRNNEAKKVEEDTILFFLATLLIHELGHLLTRWKGDHISPKTFIEEPSNISSSAEAGFFLEKLVFGNSVRLIVSKSSVEFTTQFSGMTVIKGLWHIKVILIQNLLGQDVFFTFFFFIIVSKT